MKKYKLLKAESYVDFEKALNEFAREGWEILSTNTLLFTDVSGGLSSRLVYTLQIDVDEKKEATNEDE